LSVHNPVIKLKSVSFLKFSQKRTRCMNMPQDIKKCGTFAPFPAGVQMYHNFHLPWCTPHVPREKQGDTLKSRGMNNVAAFVDKNNSEK